MPFFLLLSLPFSPQEVGSQTQICLWEIKATFQGLNPPPIEPTHDPTYQYHNTISKFEITKS
jgi:hypothetical protein